MMAVKEWHEGMAGIILCIVAQCVMVVRYLNGNIYNVRSFNDYFWNVCLFNQDFHGVIFSSTENVGVINQQYLNKKLEIYLVNDPMAKKVMCDK